jgi:hypothetical protein
MAEVDLIAAKMELIVSSVKLKNNKIIFNSSTLDKYCCENGANNVDCCLNGGVGRYCCYNNATDPNCTPNYACGKATLLFLSMSFQFNRIFIQVHSFLSQLLLIRTFLKHLVLLREFMLIIIPSILDLAILLSAMVRIHLLEESW